MDSIKQNESSVEQLIKKARINLTEEVIELDPMMQISGLSIATRGNFSCIVGKPKSRKSFLVNGLMAAAISSKNIFKVITSNLPNTKILHFDTEQSRSHVLSATKRTHRKCDLSENFEVYSLRPYSCVERLGIIENVIKRSKNVSFVFIDGIADLITSYNDEAQASMITNKLLQLTADYNIHIVTVLHENKDNRNAKGHLGSFILQKAETVLSVKKELNEEISTVTCEYSRNKPFESFSFQINNQGFMEIVENNLTLSRISKEHVRANPEDYDNKFLEDFVNDVFKTHDELKRDELIEQIKLKLEDRNIVLGLNKCRSWLDYFKNKNWITKESDKGPYRIQIGIAPL